MVGPPPARGTCIQAGTFMRPLLLPVLSPLPRPWLLLRASWRPAEGSAGSCCCGGLFGREGCCAAASANADSADTVELAGHCRGQGCASRKVMQWCPVCINRAGPNCNSPISSSTKIAFDCPACCLTLHGKSRHDYSAKMQSVFSLAAGIRAIFRGAPAASASGLVATARDQQAWKA